MSKITRRTFLKGIAVSGMATLPSTSWTQKGTNFQICIFSKHLQFLGYEEMAETAAKAGFDGIDLAVRPGGHVEPEQLEEKLPVAVEEIKKAGLSVPMMTTKIVSTSDVFAEKKLAMASQLGIKYYRMGYMEYDDNLGVMGSLQKLKQDFVALEELNRKYAIHGAYQNHAGTQVGAPVWDLRYLLAGLDPQFIGVQYDIKHATAEGGHSWELSFKLVQDWIKTIVIKDFEWRKIEGKWRDYPMPVGEGMCDFPKYFHLLKNSGFNGPISMHYEYPMPHETKKEAPKKEVIRETVEILARDLKRVRVFLQDVD